MRGTEWSFMLDTTDTNQNEISSQNAQIVSFNSVSRKKEREMYMEPVRSWEEFISGHIVEFKYYCIWHQAILTKVDEILQNITVIHYGRKKLFDTRTIMEEVLQVDLKKENFYIYHPDPENAKTPDEVIRIANSRLGEQTWGPGIKKEYYLRYSKTKSLRLHQCVRGNGARHNKAIGLHNNIIKNHPIKQRLNAGKT
ncbi:hypothetical protein CHS0354_038795 [Potamilus streckersoni]|uniref:Uncharacterized protein n=1 Tax=Potamilus streckersoni TaxID=2493646 RepID=A0AAE0W9N4_9BIVA|nr:hypothetical protein CHS0354_038795 [Potamilus streckersoni]